MYEPGHNDDFYKKAKREMKWLEPHKKDRPEREWIPPHRTASGVRFGYWRWNK